MPTMSIQFLAYLIYICTMPALYAHYACIVPNMPVLCLLGRHYACTTPNMSVLYLYCAYRACIMLTMSVLCILCPCYAYVPCTMPTISVPLLLSPYTMLVLCLIRLCHVYHICIISVLSLLFMFSFTIGSKTVLLRSRALGWMVLVLTTAGNSNSKTWPDLANSNSKN